jgi:hypothetical protein
VLLLNVFSYVFSREVAGAWHVMDLVVNISTYCGLAKHYCVSWESKQLKRVALLCVGNGG